MSTYPGSYAVPGSMQPGSIWPGDTLPYGTDMFAIFGGDIPLTYLQYLDLQTGHTLTAQPGGEYDIELASGNNAGLSIPPAGPWIPEGN